jgi:hypothetical protein
MALKDPGSFEWKILYGVSGITDVVQWAIDFIPGVGEVINEFADPVLGICLALYFQLRGISIIKDMRRLASLVGGYFAEAFTASVAPAWVIDVWYIHRTVKEEWAAEQASLIEEQEDQENQPLNRMVGGQSMRQLPVIQKPLNQGGKRLPNGGV